jgi:diacylglycerol kinase (ATP)
MAEGPHPPRKTLGHALDVLARELESFEPTPSRIRIDGRELSGDFLVASVMNLRSLGPAIGLAPDARFDDGELDVVLVRPEQRGGLLAHLRGEIDPERLPRFEVHRARRVRLEGPSTWVHVDDTTTRLEGAAEIWVEPSAARFLIPPESA